MRVFMLAKNSGSTPTYWYLTELTKTLNYLTETEKKEFERLCNKMARPAICYGFAYLMKQEREND